MAGFSSRLREKIESTRSNTATGQGPHSNQAKNIRGLTRLGSNANAAGATVSPSGGLLGGHNSCVGGGNSAGNSVPLPIQTPSLRKENGVQTTPASAIHSSPILGSSKVTPPVSTAARLESSALLGESKIVPGWGATSSNDTKNAPSGHLGGIKPRDNFPKRELDTRVGVGQERTSPPATRSQLSLSKRSRWGGNEDKRYEDFPQIGSNTVPKTGSNDRRLCHDNEKNHDGKAHQSSGSRWGDLPSPRPLAPGGGASSGKISNSHGLDNGDGRNSRRYLQHSHVDAESVDTKGANAWHGHGEKGNNHPQFSQNRVSDEVKRKEVTVGSGGDLTRPKLKPPRDADSNRYQGVSDTSVSRACNRSLYHRFVNDDSTRHVKDESTPMVLRRSNDASQLGRTKKEDHLSASECTEATQLSQLRKPALDNNPQPQHASKSAVPSLMSTLRPPSPILEEESQEGTLDSSVATKHLDKSSSDCDPQAAQLTMANHNQENIKKDKKDLAIEQQQNVLRQVAERRAAASATTKNKSLREKSNSATWERGRQVPILLEDGKEAQSSETEPVRCHKEGPDRDVLKSANKTKQKADHALAEMKQGERRNPCKIEGHDHDWNNCPNNPKSKFFVRNNPCRIAGHEHDWNDCPDNPKSVNYIPPTNKKGKKGPMSSGANETSKKCRPTVSSPLPAAADESSSICNVILNSGKEIKKNTPDKVESEDHAIKAKEVSTTKKATSTSVAFEKLPVHVNKNKLTAKPFVPAPPPTVSAWASPDTPADISSILSLTPETTKERGRITQPAISNKLEQCKELETNTSSMPLHNAHQNESSSANQITTPMQNESPPAHQNNNHPGVLFPANDVIFGRISESDSAYVSWNLPPTVMPSLCVDHFGLNLFTPTTATATSSGDQFKSIWSDGALSLITNSTNSHSSNGNSSNAKKKEREKT